MEGSGPRWAEPIKGESAPIRGGSPAAIVTMMIMCVLVEEFLFEGLMGQNLVLESLFVRCTWMPAATSCHVRPWAPFLKDLIIMAFAWYLRAPE
jgi:hypothetical protein